MNTDEYVWDPNKDKINQVKHGISFSEARKLWRGDYLQRQTYPGNDTVRYVTVGMIDGVCWVAITTPRDGKIRIISVRRAREKEREVYESVYGKEGSDGRGDRRGVRSRGGHEPILRLYEDGGKKRQ